VFSIESYSHSFVIDNVSLFNIPFYRKSCVLIIDKYLHTEMTSVSDPVYINIKVIGVVSDIAETFRLTFTV